MELIDRYVHEVGRYLSPKNRQDIQAEIRSNLMDTLEARVKGEPSEDDVVAVLKEFGPPAKVAASYRPQSQYLVGPELFPLFRTVVGIAVLVLVIVHVVLFGVLLLTNPDPLQAIKVFSGIFNNFLSVLGTIVVVFYILQYFDVRASQPEQEWNPRDLPVVDVNQQIKRGKTIFDIALGMLFLVLVLVFPNHLGVVVTPGTTILVDPVITHYIPIIAAALIACLLVNIVLLWRGRWETGTRLAMIACSLFSILVIAILISGHAVWLAEHAGGSFLGLLSSLPVGKVPASELTLTIAMFFVQWALIIAMIVTVIETIQMGFRFFRQIIGGNTAAPQIPG